jgi:hypothetical protein
MPHATIQEFAAEGFMHVELLLPAMAMTTPAMAS